MMLARQSNVRNDVKNDIDERLEELTAKSTRIEKLIVMIETS